MATRQNGKQQQQQIRKNDQNETRDTVNEEVCARAHTRITTINEQQLLSRRQ